LSPKEAEELLFERGSLEEAWVRHCLKVREAARVLGECLGSVLDRELLEVSALLHDIGRSVDQGVRHPWEGWLILQERGEPQVARAALSHWLKGRGLKQVLRTAPDLDREWVERIFQVYRPRPLTWVDNAVSVADAVVAHDRVVPIGERYRDLAVRYGRSAWLKDSERITRAQAARLSRVCGEDVEARILRELAR